MSTYKSKRVLVTGATGFVGSSLARRVADAGAEVHILTREGSNRWRLQDLPDSVVDHRVDLAEENRLRRIARELRPEIIFHCAAYGGYAFQRNTRQILETNVLGTAHLLEALRPIEFECLVHLGSSSEYGHKTHPMFEEDVLEPMSTYGISKAASTLLCQASARITGRGLVTLRLFSVFGYYEEPSRMVPYVIDCCLWGVDPILTSGVQVRDFVFIEDVLDLCLVVGLTRPVRPEIVNVGSGRQHTVRQAVEKIVALSHAQVTPRWGVLPTRPLELEMWVADTSKAKRLYGWTPKHSLDEGLRLTLEWQRGRVRNGRVTSAHAAVTR